MNTSNTLKRNLLLFAASVISISVTACSTNPPAVPGSGVVPTALQPASHEKRSFAVFARGVQIYRCTAAAGAAPSWSFVAPEAELFESASARSAIGSHGAGPFWQLPDGSKVVGKVKARAEAPTPTAIPWLLLTTTSEGKPGKLANVTSIQRTNTVGGVAPASGCASRDDIDKTARVPYTSDYVFFAGGA
jgi:Protein of unknown function (DUF3455)